MGDEAWICDSSASTNMMPSADCKINFRERNLKLQIADGSTRSMEGCGDIHVVFRSGNGIVQVLITNVAHVLDLRYHPLSPLTLVKKGHTFEGCPTGVVLRLKSARSIVFPLSETLYSLYSDQVNRSGRENACAVLAPGNCPTSLRYIPTTSPARLGTPTRYYSARPRSSKGISSTESCVSAEGAPWRRVSAKISSSPHTHEQIRSSGGFCGFKWT